MISKTAMRAKDAPREVGDPNGVDRSSVRIGRKPGGLGDADVLDLIRKEVQASRGSRGADAKRRARRYGHCGACGAGHSQAVSSCSTGRGTRELAKAVIAQLGASSPAGYGTGDGRADASGYGQSRWAHPQPGRPKLARRLKSGKMATFLRRGSCRSPSYYNGWI